MNTTPDQTAQQAQNDQKRQHYYMAAVAMTFVTDPTGTPTGSMHTLNTVTVTDENRLTMAELARIQQGAAMTLYTQLEEQVPILSSTIVMLSYLGFMTQDEFLAEAEENAPPTGAVIN